MPRKDMTGPSGVGPGTGRRMGLCSGGPVSGRIMSGRGFGWRRFWGYYPTPIVNTEEEREILCEEVEILEEELKAVRKRLEEIKK